MSLEISILKIFWNLCIYIGDNNVSKVMDKIGLTQESKAVSEIYFK